jgi:hypothetical protein
VLYPSRDSQHEQESSQRKAFQRAVLRYLSVNGPSQWSEIYTQFDQQNSGASITDALRCLASLDSITIAFGGRAAITASGVDQLQRLE